MLAGAKAVMCGDLGQAAAADRLELSARASGDAIDAVTPKFRKS